LKYLPIKINPTTKECLINPKTGNFLREGCDWNHDLHGDLEDFFERASYICKVKTKVSLSSWSCSKLMQFKKPQVTTLYRKITQQYARAKPNIEFIPFNQQLVSISQLQSSLISNQSLLKCNHS